MIGSMLTVLLKILSTCGAILLGLYLLFKWKYQYWKRRNVPHLEPTIPFGSVGNVFVQQRDEIVTDIYKIAKSKGWRYCGLYTLLSPAILIVDVDLIKKVMATDFQYFCDRGMYTNENNDPAGCNIFTLPGSKWRSLRAKLTSTFTSGKIKAMFQTLLDCGLALEKYLKENVVGDVPVDIKDIMHRYSTDVIGSCAFGVDCNSFKDPNTLVRQLILNFFYASKLDYVVWLFMDNFPNLARSLGIRQVRKDINDFFVEMVHKTVAYREANDYVRKDFMQLLIDLKNGKIEEDRPNGVSGSLTMDEIVGHSFLFFIAGAESSSTTLTFALFELAVHQEIQDRLRDEMDAVFAKYGTTLTYDSANELKYMGQVIDETLRRYPPARVLERVCVRDYSVPGEDVVIEKGTRVFISAKGVQYDEEFWQNPDDFDPNRFNEETKHINQYAYLPFGEGPRGCMGERFGKLQVKVGLASVLRRYRVSLNERTKLPLSMSVNTLFSSAEGEIWLNLEKT